jgi:leucyl-tRNA synthetase
LTNQGIILGPDGYKMSKSKGNVVNPDEQVTSYGTDSLRLYLMFMGPYDQGGPYNLTGIAGTRRFLDRYWVLVEEFIAAGDESGERDLELKAMTHKTIKKVTQDLVVSADISETDAIEAAKADSKIAEQIGSQEIKKAIYVPGRLVSLVV